MTMNKHGGFAGMVTFVTGSVLVADGGQTV
jgi:hypothetical protein